MFVLFHVYKYNQVTLFVLFHVYNQVTLFVLFHVEIQVSFFMIFHSCPGDHVCAFHIYIHVTSLHFMTKMKNVGLRCNDQCWAGQPDKQPAG